MAWLWLLAFFDDLIRDHRIDEKRRTDDDWIDDDWIDELSDQRGSHRPKLPVRHRCRRAGA